MGMTVIGSLGNIILFNSACSSQIPTIEYGIMRNLDFIYQYGTVSMDVMGSVARDMFYAFWTGTDLEIFAQNGYTFMKLMGRDDLILLYDPETGIVRDINTMNSFYGAYCFHDQITDSAYDFFGGVKNSTSTYRDWAHESIEDLIQDTQWFYEHFNWNKFNWTGASVLGMASGGGIVLYGLAESAFEDTVGALEMAAGAATFWASWNTFWDYWDDPWFT